MMNLSTFTTCMHGLLGFFFLFFWGGGGGSWHELEDGLVVPVRTIAQTLFEGTQSNLENMCNFSL